MDDCEGSTDVFLHLLDNEMTDTATKPKKRRNPTRPPKKFWDAKKSEFYQRDWKTKTKYTPDMDEESIAFLATGASMIELAAHFNINQRTLHEWVNDPLKQSFGTAIRVGKEKSRAWHAKYMRDNMNNRNYNERAHSKLLRWTLNLPEDPYVSIPDLSKAQDAAKQSQIVLKAIAESEITPIQAKDIAQTIMSGVAADDHVNVKKELAEVKKQLGVD